MAETVREIVWLQSYIKDLDISSPFPMPIYYDHKAAIFLTKNSTVHECT